MLNNLSEEIENTLKKIKASEETEVNLEKKQEILISEFHKDLNLFSKTLNKFERNYSELLDTVLKMETEEKILKFRDKQSLRIFADMIEPLETLTGFFKIMDQFSGSLTEQEIKSFALRMDVSVKNMLIKIENLIKWLVTQMGNFEFMPEKLDLNQVLKENLAFFNNIAKRKDISIMHNLNEDEFYVKADLNMVNYILRNLLSNAIKFSYAKGKVRVEARKVNNSIEIRVIDEGVGMTEELVNQLFKEGHQFTKVGTQHEKGYGLGLLPAKEFVNKHKGEMFVHSEPKHGTIVGFTLPVYQSKSKSKKRVKSSELHTA